MEKMSIKTFESATRNFYRNRTINNGMLRLVSQINIREALRVAGDITSRTYPLLCECSVSVMKQKITYQLCNVTYFEYLVSTGRIMKGSFQRHSYFARRQKAVKKNETDFKIQEALWQLDRFCNGPH